MSAVLTEQTERRKLGAGLTEQTARRAQGVELTEQTERRELDAVLTKQTERQKLGAGRSKRILAGLLAAGMILSATACGSKEVSVTLEANLEEVGVSVKETRVLEGKGDTLASMQETLEVDLSAFTAEQKAAAVATYEAMKDGFQAIEGVACVGTDNGNGYTLELSVDCSGDVGELLNQGIIEGGETNGSISIKELQSILEDSGYTVVK